MEQYHRKETIDNLPISDANSETKHISCTEAAQLAFSSFDSEINKHQQLKIYQNSFNLISIPESNYSNKEIDESYGLINICKEAKLSKEQLGFLRKKLKLKDLNYNVNFIYEISHLT